MQIKPDKKYYTVLYLTVLTISVAIVIAAVILQILIPLSPKASLQQVAQVVWPLALLAIVLLWIIGVPIIILWVKNLSYYIEDDRISLHKGILSKIQQNIPYRAITDFQLHRSLYDRWLGIGTIRISTAGQSHQGTGYEGKMPGLINWGDLHTELRAKIKHLHPLSGATGVSEPPSKDTQTLILEELRAIRKGLER